MADLLEEGRADRENGAADHGTAPTSPRPTPPKPKRVVLDYTVVSGDTLGRIAHKEEVAGGWKVVWNKNRKRVPNPDSIYVGQRLDVK